MKPTVASTICLFSLLLAMIACGDHFTPQTTTQNVHGSNTMQIIAVQPSYTHTIGSEEKGRLVAPFTAVGDCHMPVLVFHKGPQGLTQRLHCDEKQLITTRSNGLVIRDFSLRAHAPHSLRTPGDCKPHHMLLDEHGNWRRCGLVYIELSRPIEQGEYYSLGHDRYSDPSLYLMPGPCLEPDAHLDNTVELDVPYGVFGIADGMRWCRLELSGTQLLQLDNLTYERYHDLETYCPEGELALNGRCQASPPSRLLQ